VGDGSERAAALPTTRAERTGYRETSTHQDVVEFLDSLQALGAPMWVGSVGRSTEGRDLPLVVLSRPRVASPAQAQRLDRPIVYVQANIHAGEVEGKEALQAIIRDLSFAPTPNLLDSLVVLAVPIYNADGNERFGPQARNREEQNGPELVGVRANAQGLDLNRDYIKAEAPETRGSLAALREWDPDVFVDLHTTNGSFHGYALTYAPSLNPAAFFGGLYARDSLLPELRRRMRTRHALEVFDYGNFSLRYGSDFRPGVRPDGWYSYDSRPRFGTNYVGLRGRIGVLSEAYSHDPFERRVASTGTFVRELLSLTAERADDIRALARLADSTVTAWGRQPERSRPVPLRAELTREPHPGDVIMEELESTGDSSVTEAGVPAGVRRSGRFVTVRIPVHDRFSPTLARTLPYAHVIPAAEREALALLRVHGIVLERLTREWPTTIESFVIDSIATAARPFQGHREVQLTGRWHRERRTLPAGSYLASSSQPLGIVAMYLLDPESDDGLTTWNVFDARLSRGAAFPILRVVEPVRARRRIEP
jgi:hypothetical protein